MTQEMTQLEHMLREAQGDNTPDLIQRLHQYRHALSMITKPIKVEASTVGSRYGGDEITLAWRSLQQAKMWLGMALGVNQVDPPWEKDGDN